MAPVYLHANRNLRPRVLESGERRGLANYYAFTHGARPCWWEDGFASDATGKVIGVFENEDSSPTDALVLTDEEVIVLARSGRWSFRYDQVRTFEPPGLRRKEPIAETLLFWLEPDGRRVDLPVRNSLGAAYTFYRFLIYAVGEKKKATTALG